MEMQKKAVTHTAQPGETGGNKPLVKPFIKRFKTNGNYYVYDSNTNHITRVDKPVWDALEFFGEYPDETVETRLAGTYPAETVRQSLDSIRDAQKNKDYSWKHAPKSSAPIFPKTNTARNWKAISGT